MALPRFLCIDDGSVWLLHSEVMLGIFDNTLFELHVIICRVRFICILDEHVKEKKML